MPNLTTQVNKNISTGTNKSGVHTHKPNKSNQITNKTGSPPMNIGSFFYNLTQTEQEVARHISYYANKAWGFCQKTFETIATECGCSLKTVDRTMRKLKKEGVAQIKRMGQLASRISVLKKFREFLFKRRNGDVTGRPIPYILNTKQKADAKKNMKLDLTQKDVDEIERVTVKLAEEELERRGIFQPQFLMESTEDNTRAFERYINTQSDIEVRIRRELRKKRRCELNDKNK